MANALEQLSDKQTATFASSERFYEAAATFEEAKDAGCRPHLSLDLARRAQ